MIFQGRSRKEDGWDNAAAENFAHMLKTKLVMHCTYETEEARAGLFEHMKVFFNSQRRHSSLSYASPLEFGSIIHLFIQVSTERG